MSDEKAVKYYKLTCSNQEQINMIEKLFVLMQYLGTVGASRKINLYVDGDGAVHPKFSARTEDEYVFRTLNYDECMEKDGGFGVTKINLDSGKDDAIWIDLG